MTDLSSGILLRFFKAHKQLFVTTPFVVKLTSDPQPQGSQSTNGQLCFHCMVSDGEN
ncbi:hypothetical protein H4R27_004184, partial [Coemansia aciculifera]